MATCIQLRIHPLQEELGLQTDPEDEHHQRRRARISRGLRSWHAGRSPVLVLGLAQRSEEHPLDQPQHVPGAQHDAQHGQHGITCNCMANAPARSAQAALEHAEQDQELAGEAVQARQADARQA